MRRRRKLPPEAPIGAYLKTVDGKQISCDVLYDGVDPRGFYRWYLVPEFWIDPKKVVEIGASMLPPSTAIVFTVEK